MHSTDGHGIWQELYRTHRAPVLPDTLVGFNLNLDRVIPVTRDLLDAPALRTRSLSPLRARLLRSMPHYTAEEWFVKDPGRYRHYSDYFSSSGSIAVGGQAGIASLHLAGCGTRRVVCATPLRSPEAARILARSGVVVPDLADSAMPDAERVHLVFEYAPGLVPAAPGALPRHNRFIVSPAHSPASVLLAEPSMDRLLGAAASCTRGFFSGYQYLRETRDFRAAADQLARIKEANPSLRTHIEWVSGTGRDVSRRCARHIMPVADSFGLNVQEMIRFMSHLGTGRWGSLREGSISPVDVVNAALCLGDELGLGRLHVHTYGYYVLVSGSTAGDAVATRNALLYAARVTAESACGAGTSIPEEGIRAVSMAAAAFPQESPGIFRAGSRTVLVVPALIAGNIAKTSGLGDILSSTAFVADVL